MDLDFSKIDSLGSPQKPANEFKATDNLKEYQANKKLTTSIVAEINHGLQQGEDIYDLFLKAVEGLALTTNDPNLIARSREAIQSVYADVDLHIFGFEMGMEYTQEVEIIDGEITINEETTYNDYAWDVPFENLGG